MTLPELKDHIRSLLSKDRQKEALAAILTHVKADAPIRNDFIQLQGRLSRIERDVRLGLLDYQEQTKQQNVIRHTLMELLAELTDPDLQQMTASAQSALQKNELDALARQGLERQAELLLKKINRTREALALEDDPGRQIRYETQLEQWETELANLKQRAGI